MVWRSSRGFNVVICDESHYLKSISAERTKKTLPIVKKAKRCILLTGTPALNRPDEIFAQLDAIDAKIFSSHQKYGLRYCNAHRVSIIEDLSGEETKE